jgi:hypothetical protein
VFIAFSAKSDIFLELFIVDNKNSLSGKEKNKLSIKNYGNRLTITDVIFDKTLRIIFGIK